MKFALIGLNFCWIMSENVCLNLCSEIPARHQPDVNSNEVLDNGDEGDIIDINDNNLVREFFCS